MVTDDERRRVAEALREYASFDCECEDKEEFSVDCADWGERVLNLLGCGDTESACYARLADLIEPESGQNRDSVQIRVQKGPECDREAVLNVAESMDSYAWLMVQLGVDTVPDVILGYVRRIREACGEVA